MRVLLPFYEADSSDSRSSSDEGQGNYTNRQAEQAEDQTNHPLTRLETVDSGRGDHKEAAEEFAFGCAVECGIVNFDLKETPETDYSLAERQCNNNTEECNDEHSPDNKRKLRDDSTLPSEPVDALALRIDQQKEEAKLPSLSSVPVSLDCKTPAPLATQGTNPKKRFLTESNHGPTNSDASAPYAALTAPSTHARKASIYLVPSLAPQDFSAAFVSIVSKRPRTDSKPPAKDLLKAPDPKSNEDWNMAVGGGNKRRGIDSDEEDAALSFTAYPAHYYVHQPAENEPPVMQNQPVVASLLSTTSMSSSMNPDDPAQSLLPDFQENLPLQPIGMKDRQYQKQKAPCLNKFRAALKKHGLEMVEQEGDGNCLFRAVSLQVYGQSDNHAEVRERCLDFMAANEEHYSNFVAATAEDQTFQDYIARKRRDGVHGNHAEIQAISELFNRPVELYSADSSKPMNIFHAEYKTSDPPIRLSYHDGNHYNAVVDPLMPTAYV